MAQEIAVAAASEVIKEATSDTYGLLKQQISYVFKYQNYINDLKNQVRELRNKRETVQRPVESAQRQGEEIYELVTTWLRDVDEFTEGVAKTIIEDEDKANKGGCFKLGSCPNLIQRYRLGQKAMKATKDGAHLLGKAPSSPVSYRPALQRTESMYVRGYEAFDSRMQVLQEIMDSLKDANVNMIGVYGMGGVGKTTLVRKVAWLAKENKLFDEVAVVEVTQSPDYKKIQEKVAFDLGLEFGQESEYQRPGLLRSRIKKEKNVLVIFDNIWTKVDLDAIGIPFGGAEKQGKDDKVGRCTVLLTSRSLDVLYNGMNTQKNISVTPLSDGEAWNLFRKIVGDSAESPDFHPVAVQIVTKCAGLPVAISTIAHALKTESLNAWEDTLAQLKRSNPRCILDMDETLYSTIELSYKFLKNEEAKTLFLLCALSNAGSSISTHDLLKYSMGWSLFGDGYTLEEGRNRLQRLIGHLKASCLLLDYDEGDDRVKMHDIIHAVAVSIASTDKFMFNIQNATGLKEVLEEKKDSTAISLPYRDIYDELPEKLECPKLKFFLLATENQNLQIPDTFFEGMRELKVLDLTGIQLLSLPSSLYCLKKIRTLCFYSCLLGDVAIVGKLKTLEILSFVGSDIEQLPGEIRQLTRLKLLDLSNCLNLRYIAPNVISCLSQLEELYMGNTFVQWEVEGVDNQGRRNASLGELKRLSNLTALHLHIQDARVMPRDLFFKKLKSYKIFIGDKWKWSGKYNLSTSKMFKLKINNSIYLTPAIKTLLKITEDLSLEEMNGVRNILYELNMDGFPHLKHLLVKDGHELLFIIKSVAWNVVFPKLESLILRNLINLEKICHGQLNGVSFNKLRILKIEKCDRLEHLFASFVAKNLTQLQEIEVTDCKNLKEIFGEESKDHGDEIETNDKIEFNQLCSLTLQRLPQLIKIGSNMRTVFPRLENLKLCSINIENTWLDQLLAMSSYSQCLKSLIVEECNGLKFLFSSSMVKSLNQLQKLVIGNCMSMEVIIYSKGEERIIDMSFPKLFYLKLEVLPILVSFGTGNSIKFPSLNELHIDSCSNLKTFFNKSFYSDMVREEPEEKVKLENYFIDINPLFDKKVAFPSLETMVLLHLDNLQLIWHSQQLHVESFCKLKKVRIEFCKNLKTIVPSNSHGLHTFHNLEELTIQNCWSMKSLFPVNIATSLTQLKHLHLVSCGLEKIVSEEEVKEAPRFSLSQLACIYLNDLPELEYFYPGLHTIEWPMLNRLVVYHCKKIKIYASEFPSFQKKDDGGSQPALFLLEKVIPNLEELGIDAHDFRLTFLHSDLVESFGKLKKLMLGNFDDESVASLFSFLKRLNCLESLFFTGNGFKELFSHEQGHIWKQDFRGDTFLQNLKTLEVEGCHYLTILMPSAMSFKNLTNLDTWSCNGLVNILACSTAKTLVNLVVMRIRECKLVIEVIANEGDREEEIVFGQLKILELYCLSSLAFFCSANYSFKFPYLEHVLVSQCPKLKIFSQGVLSTPLLKRVTLTKEDDSEYFWKEDLNSTIQQMFTDMVGFHNFEHLALSQFPNMKEKIWNGQIPSDLFWNLKTLVVDKFSDMSSAIPSKVFCHFKNLEILDVRSCESLEQVFDFEMLNANGIALEENRQEILGLQKLKSLKIDNCNSLRYVFTPSILLGLVQLQEIEVKNCALIEEIIKEEGEKYALGDKIIIPQLNSVMLESLPNLTSFYSGSDILECPPLKAIIIKDCQKIHMKEFNIHLASLFTVKVVLPSLEASSCFQNLTILIIDGFNHLKYLFSSSTIKSLVRLKQLEISKCKLMERIIHEDEKTSSTMLFPKLYELKLLDLPKLTTFYNSATNFVEMSSLFRLWIKNCPGVQTFISNSICGGMTSSSKENEETNAKENFTQTQSLFNKKVRFPSLERLSISHADELEKIWDDQVSLDSFCKLNRVFVHFCKRLVSVFPSNMLGRHQKLEYLEVQNCDSVEVIFEVHEKRSSEVDAIVDKEGALPRNFEHSRDSWRSQQPLFLVYKDAFPSMEELELCKMPKLLHLRKGNSQPRNAFQNLKTLKVSECCSLGNSWSSSVSFQNLETLQVSKCDGLRYLMTSLKAKTLDHLTRMIVSDCKMMEEIITHLGDEERQDPIVFNRLNCLELHCLSNLKSFCCGDYALEFPSLTKVSVSQCLKMETFCHGDLSTPKLQKLQLTKGENEVEECWEGNLNSTIQHLFINNMNARSSKED